MCFCLTSVLTGPLLTHTRTRVNGLSDGASSLGDVNKSTVWVWGCLGVLPLIWRISGVGSLFF